MLTPDIVQRARARLDARGLRTVLRCITAATSFAEVMQKQKGQAAADNGAPQTQESGSTDCSRPAPQEAEDVALFVCTRVVVST